MKISKQPLAHLDGERPHFLVDHLEAVGELAARYAAVFGAAELGRQAGRSHDLGKVPKEFQRRLYGDPRRFEHSIHGAQYWMQPSRRHGASLVLAAMIAGHHAGLPDVGADALEGRPRNGLKTRLLKKVDLGPVLSALPPGFLAERSPLLPARLTQHQDDPKALRRQLETFSRFLFSALVDADIVDTTAFAHGDERRRLVANFAQVEELSERLDHHLDRLVARATHKGVSKVNRLRAEVLAACRDAAELPPGLFSLTVPTGGGKTLSAMSFALRHAKRHGLRRVITAIPYTSIIEQNAKIYIEALGRDQVIEHHSAFEPDKLGDEDDELRRRHELAAENWDAPVVVTTNVQLFESLFANRTSRCRKLHNIARSVILLDEAQTVPIELLSPILDMLRELVENYGCSVVFATATQPAFGQRRGLPEGLADIREIAPDPTALARQLARYEVEWRLEEIVTWPELAEELTDLPQVLCIVHSRADAQLLAEALADQGQDAEAVVHLSAAMCGEHRSEVLDRVRQRLVDGLPCRLISTQLIEAGVDVDFPVVFRALAGLESLIQAAGRCNREGKLPGRGGRFVVFKAPSRPPQGVPRQGLAITQGMRHLAEGDLNTHDPAIVESYFRRLYSSTKRDPKAIQDYRSRLAFASVAHYFKMIDSSWSQPLVVPWGKSAKVVAEIKRWGPNRDRLRRLQRYTVNAPRRHLTEWLASGMVEPVGEVVFAVSEIGAEKMYSPRWGLSGSTDIGLDPGALMV